MYYCFEVAHRRIVAARRWAGNSPVDQSEREKFAKTRGTIILNLNREAIRLNAFMTLAANRIETIRVSSGQLRPIVICRLCGNSSTLSAKAARRSGCRAAKILAPAAAAQRSAAPAVMHHNPRAAFAGGQF
jgi:hypothetical protein